MIKVIQVSGARSATITAIASASPRRLTTATAAVYSTAVARDQLPYAKAELSTHDNQRVTKALNDGLQAALTQQYGPAGNCLIPPDDRSGRIPTTENGGTRACRPSYNWATWYLAPP